MQHLQNIHPMIVHFPIAFLVGAALLYISAWVFRAATLATTAFHLLILGVLAAGAAVGTGLYAEEGVMLSRSVREHLLEVHEALMLTALGVSVLLGVWALLARPFPKRGRWVFGLGLLALLGVMSLGADYGARMVYDYNAGGTACPQPIEFIR